jgi:hypothetical protein
MAPAESEVNTQSSLPVVSSPRERYIQGVRG